MWTFLYFNFISLVREYSSLVSFAYPFSVKNSFMYRLIVFVNINNLIFVYFLSFQILQYSFSIRWRHALLEG